MVRQDAQDRRFGSGAGLGLAFAVDHDAGQIRNFLYSAAIRFLFKFDYNIHNLYSPLLTKTGNLKKEKASH